MSNKDRIYKTPGGYYWMCNDSKCLEERDNWGKDDKPTEFYHCANPEGCHGVLWLEKDGVECKICGRYYCQTCASKVSGRFTDTDSDLTKKQLKEYEEDDFLCYECVPKNESKLENISKPISKSTYINHNRCSLLIIINFHIINMKINSMILINLLAIFLIIILIGIFIYIKSNTKHKRIESPFEHIYNENCDPVSGSLKSCSTIGETCLECEGGSDGKNIYSCQEVKYARDDKGNILPGETDKWKIYKPNSDDSDKKSQLGVIPEGRWCLPVKVDKINCNPYTSDSILTKVSDNNYRWRCKCKYPQYVTSDNLDGDCNIQVACNHQEDPDNNYLVYCPDGSKTCDNPVKWDDKAQIDLSLTFCNCGKDTFPYNNDSLNIKTCLKDPCGGLGTYNQKFQDCNCNEGTVNVRNLPSNHAQEYEGIGCIQDPCENGKYDITSKACVCNKGYTLIKDENFISNGYCVKDDNVCENTPNSTARDCVNRGGYCQPKMVSLGYGDRVIPVPQCKGCLPPFGFRNGRDDDCTRALLNFVECNADSQCSSGRCHESGGLFGIGTSKACAPCNDPGDFIENQNSGKQSQLQSQYDRKCRDLGTGQFCNLYSDVSGGENLHPEYGKYLGVCENTNTNPGSSRLNGKEFKRY